jgi:hypothetical protein
VGNAIYTIPKELVRRLETPNGAAVPVVPAQGAAAPAPAAVTPAAKPAADPPAPAANAQPVRADVPPAKTPEQKADELIQQAEAAMAQRTYPTARTALEIVLKLYPGTPAATRAATMLHDVPNEHGRLVMGFDDQSDVGGSGAQWISDPKVVPVGKGAAHITDLRGRHARFPLEKAETFASLRSVNFWVWSGADYGGLSTGTTYFCFYTDDPKDFLSASFQMRGDLQWRQISLDVGRFKEWNRNKGRRFTAVGFWNPGRVEVRDFLVDDIRVIEAEPPKAGALLVAPTEGLRK